MSLIPDSIKMLLSRKKKASETAPVHKEVKCFRLGIRGRLCGVNQLCQQLPFIFNFTLCSSVFSFWFRRSAGIPCLGLITFRSAALISSVSGVKTQTNKAPVPVARHLFSRVFALNCLCTVNTF